MVRRRQRERSLFEVLLPVAGEFIKCAMPTPSNDSRCDDAVRIRNAGQVKQALSTRWHRRDGASVGSCPGAGVEQDPLHTRHAAIGV